MALKKKSILLIMAFLIGCFVCACGKEDSIVDESLVEDTEDVSSTEEIKSADYQGGQGPFGGANGGYQEFHFDGGDMDDILKNIFGGGFSRSEGTRLNSSHSV